MIQVFFTAYNVFKLLTEYNKEMLQKAVIVI